MKKQAAKILQAIHLERRVTTHTLRNIGLYSEQ